LSSFLVSNEVRTLQLNKPENLDDLITQAEHYGNWRVVPDGFEIMMRKSSAEISKITPWGSMMRMDEAVGRIFNRFSL
jgi:hypothetical protein